jgi:hypothetical protein
VTGGALPSEAAVIHRRRIEVLEIFVAGVTSTGSRDVITLFALSLAAIVASRTSSRLHPNMQGGGWKPRGGVVTGATGSIGLDV